MDDQNDVLFPVCASHDQSPNSMLNGVIQPLKLHELCRRGGGCSLTKYSEARDPADDTHCLARRGWLRVRRAA